MTSVAEHIFLILSFRLFGLDRWGASINGRMVRNQFGAQRTFRTREDAAQALREIRDLQEPPPLTQE
jgi:hypothetical protein